MHPDLAPLAFLIGSWTGRGKGRYPTIEPFEYFEEATYTPGPGKPFIAYSQRTRRAGGGGEPLHSEAGYIRPAGPGKAELVIAQPTGIVEVHTGEVQDGRVDFRTSLVGLSKTAVEVAEARRRLEVEGGTMHYRLWMAAVGQPIQVHLEAELARVSGH
ncbi:MAG: FABP family protein [bacterium]|nr:FABP family protein [bacterium]MDE0289116.1 FABP family protein [bacterium]MDE0440383.1 FABP family protein [bacterium]